VSARAAWGPGIHALAVDALDAIVGAQAGAGRNAFAAPDQRLEIGLADHEHRPQQGQAQHQVEGRSGECHQETLPGRLAVEGLVALRGRDIVLALVEELHVAAERNGRDDVFDAVRRRAAPQRPTESDGELEDLDAEAPRHPEMAELVDGDQDRDRHDEGQHRGAQGRQRRHRTAPAEQGRTSPARAQASAARTSPSSLTGAMGWAFMTSSITAGIRANPAAARGKLPRRPRWRR
jgi:hypothetical protein